MIPGVHLSRSAKSKDAEITHLNIHIVIYGSISERKIEVNVAIN